MNWGSFAEFVHMGGYGLYVWGSYAMVVVAFAVEISLVRYRNRQAHADLFDTTERKD